jgi:hypothetical protein
MAFFAWLEETGLSNWMRESTVGFFGALIVHSLAMGLVVGINLMVALRLLGIAPRIPAGLLQKFFPLMWSGVVAIVLSGLLLLLAYPAKALTNWVFYFKLVCVTGGLLLGRYFVRQLAKHAMQTAIPLSLKQLAVLSIALWVCGITAGRFLAYTHTVLLAYRNF